MKTITVETQPTSPPGQSIEARPMVVVFCDLKGSTRVLRELGPAVFKELQEVFFEQSSNIIESANREQHKGRANLEELIRSESNPNTMKKLHYPPPWARIDKFMGDCTMFYIDCQRSTETASDRSKTDEQIFNEAADITMRVVSSLASTIVEMEKMKQLKDTDLELGTRIGVALGAPVFLSWLGEPNKPGYSYTVTGAPVNLAARLEHASKADFLSCIADEKARLQDYQRFITNSESLHGTRLEEVANESDQYLVNLHAVCEKRFQVRANQFFFHALENCREPVKLRWRKVQFAPKGFEGRQTAFLLGGDSPAELLRTV